MLCVEVPPSRIPAALMTSVVDSVNVIVPRLSAVPDHERIAHVDAMDAVTAETFTWSLRFTVSTHVRERAGVRGSCERVRG
jgi:hypothetical protein